MSLAVWLAYAAAVTILSLIPGPSVFMAISQSLSKGLSASMFSMLGNLPGGVVMMTVAHAGRQGGIAGRKWSSTVARPCPKNKTNREC